MLTGCATPNHYDYPIMLIVVFLARKLEVGSLVKSNACWLFYKFFSIAQLEHYDEYVSFFAWNNIE